MNTKINSFYKDRLISFIDDLVVALKEGVITKDEAYALLKLAFKSDLETLFEQSLLKEFEGDNDTKDIVLIDYLKKTYA